MMSWKQALLLFVAGTVVLLFSVFAAMRNPDQPGYGAIAGFALAMLVPGVWKVWQWLG